MAFKQTVNFMGMTIPDAYHVIDVTSSTKNQGCGSLNVYFSKETFESGLGYIYQEQFEFPVDFGNTVGSDRYQAYQHLLSTEKYKDAKIEFDE